VNATAPRVMGLDECGTPSIDFLQRVAMLAWCMLSSCVHPSVTRPTDTSFLMPDLGDILMGDTPTGAPNTGGVG